MKRQLIDWEKILVIDVTDKGLVSKIYKQFTDIRTATIKKMKNIHFWQGDRETGTCVHC